MQGHRARAAPRSHEPVAWIVRCFFYALSFGYLFYLVEGALARATQGLSRGNTIGFARIQST